MKDKKQLFIVAFALFSLFFGAGNLILPPQLGFKAGSSWGWVTLGFAVSAVIIPIFGILAHARLQGTLFDIAKKVSPAFSLVYCYLIYAISLALPAPRTASVTHEMGIAPFFDVSSWWTSTLYFALVFVFVINRSKIMDIIGKFLTPAILLILVAIVGAALLDYEFSLGPSAFPHPFSHGILEGYQTFDAIGAVVVGGVIIISVNLEHGHLNYQQKRKLIGQAGFLAGLGLLLIYAGLIFTGALMHSSFSTEISRTELLSGISRNTLGNAATLFLSVLVSLACFTTAVGIVTGAADFIKGHFGNSQKAYVLTVALGCILGVLMGQFNVGYIILVALPALMFIYPVTIVLILLNLLPEKFASKLMFRWVVGVTLLFSVPDFLGSTGIVESISGLTQWIPLSAFHMGWVLPSALTCCVVLLFKRIQI
ncbi:MAG: branched-chain amino acid transport system II carrier protein [Bacteroidota bacterium]